MRRNHLVFRPHLDKYPVAHTVKKHIYLFFIFKTYALLHPNSYLKQRRYHGPRDEAFSVA